MNKDIQTLIEREAEKYRDEEHRLLVTKAYHSTPITKSFQAGASFAISLFKWRKVSDELPEETGWDKAPYLVKTKQGMEVVGYTEGCWHLKGGLCMKPNKVIEWMPIPNIGD